MTTLNARANQAYNDLIEDWNWPDVYSWKVTCGFKCGHAHHEDEVWLAGASSGQGVEW
jgi:hypothetical protein